jgi:Na+/H+-dicarboxylate symporter
MLSYGVSSIISTFEAGLKTTHTNGGSNLQPNFILSIPKIISNDIALVFGVLSGFIVGLFKNGTAIKMSVVLDKFTKLFFKVLIPLMPLFIVGTAVKLQQDGILTSIVEKYLPILCIFLFAACGAITVQLVVLAKFRIGKVLEYIKNTLPAMITALGSMSSAAALPLSIEAAEKNLQDKTNAGIIVPSVVNIHLVGDCFFIPMIAIAVMVSFNLDFPDISKYLLFAVHFVIAKFAVAAVPGGGVLVMLPIMQKYLGLSADMLALVTALYVLFDPLITMCNVAGNASMAIAFDKVVGRMTKR